MHNQVDTGLMIPGSQIGLYSAVNLQYGAVHGLEFAYELAAPKDKELLFVPDENLGAWVMEQTGRPMTLWKGNCYVHVEWTHAAILRIRQEYPDAPVVAHPECTYAVRMLADEGVTLAEDPSPLAPDAAFEALQPDWSPALWVIAAATMIVGTVVGVAQTSVKRMLAYSSIAHGGYLIVGLVAANSAGKAAILFYLARRFPAARLLPDDLDSQARAISWMSFIASSVHPARRQGEAHAFEIFGVADRRLGANDWAVGSACSIA